MPLWSGTETELTCDKLTPGTTYRIRISCFNGQEHSDFSETLIVTTEPVCPGAPAAPRLVGKAKSSHLQLEWGNVVVVDAFFPPAAETVTDETGHNVKEDICG